MLRMKALYLRIYLTLVVLLLAFAFGSAWLFQRHIEQERGSQETSASERMAALLELLGNALPAADAPQVQQALALEDWSQRLHLAVALDGKRGERLASSELFLRREAELSQAASDGAPVAAPVQLVLDDGRSLLVLRQRRPMPGLPLRAGGDLRGMRGQPPHMEPAWFQPIFGPRPNGHALLALLVLLFFGVAIGAFPVVRRLTRRLESLKQGVERFGAGNLAHRVDDQGNDEVAALAVSFNRAASQLETLLRSQQTLLANASHELRSPLARLKMAFAMLDDAGEVQRARLTAEIHTNIRELDALVEEVLLASRLDSGVSGAVAEKVDLLGMAAEESARVGAQFESEPGLSQLTLMGEDRLLRRAMRNLLENARRYGGDEVLLQLSRSGTSAVVRVCDRGPGVPEPMRERIFEAFFRLPGHAEQAGGVGLGLSLVKQIAQRHGGTVRCESRPGGGSCFVLTLPLN
nr:ATP-binding protein [uncultured Roseateles sp.]